MYQNLKGGLEEKEREDSVHFLMVRSIPNFVPSSKSRLQIPDAEEEVEGAKEANFSITTMVKVVELGRALRTDGKCKVGWKTVSGNTGVVGAKLTLSNGTLAYTTSNYGKH